MDTSLEALLTSIYTFSTGRRLWALGQMQKVAAELKLKELQKLCGEAIEHDQQTRSLESAWAASSVAVPASRMVQLDVALDRILVSLRDVVQAHLTGSDEKDPLRDKAQLLLTRIFPNGVQAVTQVSHVEEIEAVDGIVAELGGKELKPIVDELGATRIVKRLSAKASEYRAALEAPAPDTLKFSEVKASRAAGQNNLLQAIALVLGSYHRSDDSETRTRLLRPVLEQNEAIRMYLRNRRAIQDVDPATGEVDPNAPIATPPGEVTGAPAAPPS